MQQIKIRDFSGGLNTAMDESNVPANMTPDLLNVDFLDSKAISRRNGYIRQTASYIVDSPVKSLYRYYKKDGGGYWLAVCATQLYSMSLAAGGDSSSATVQAESAWISASSTGATSDAQLPLSGGAGVVCASALSESWIFADTEVPITATIAISLPAFTSAEFGFYTLDEGSYQTTPSTTLLASAVISIGASTYTVPPITSATATSFVTVYTVNTGASAGTAFVKVNAINNGISSDQGWGTRRQYLDYVTVRNNATSIAFASIQSGLSASADTYSFVTYNDTCYISSAYDIFSSYTGATFAFVNATNAPSVKFMVEKGRRLFGAGNASDMMKLYYTELDDPEDWGVGTQNGLYLGGKDSGQGCTGLAVANDLLYFFTETSTYALDTRGLPENWTAKTLSTMHGCVAPGSIAVAPNGVIFLAGDGVRSHGSVEGIYSDDGSVFTILSDNITPTLLAYTDSERAAAHGCIYNNRYWLSLGGDVYVCDLEKRTENSQPPWTKYSGIDANCFYVTRSDEYGIYCGGADNGYLYKLDTGGTDNGEAISMKYKTPPLAPGGYTAVKHFRHTHVAAESPTPQTLSVAVNTDDVSSAAQDVSLDASTDIQPKRLLTPARGRSAQITLSSDGLEQPLTVSELTITYNPVPRVR